MSSILQFPSRNTIIEYLTEHPLTTDPIFEEKKLIVAAAKAFANKEKQEFNVQMGVMKTVCRPKIIKGLDDDKILKICLDLTRALKDCAKGYIISDLK